MIGYYGDIKVDVGYYGMLYGSVFFIFGKGIDGMRSNRYG